ncbi:tRNA (adenosine(37)-N6)-threonylcarbamoyltransferase complex dimerization subunit type 1 TsaB [bacterium]|nr:tRNA (adenosine(37)-N6)-threonylcarbamoyltransferase complex dimerization subunit type 1 TsaB [bacterium]
MTVVLGIETATPVCSVGLARTDGPDAEISVEAANAAAERLPDCVHSVLSAAGLTPASLDGVAVSIGPGSYTGLRIGLSFAKGLCFAAGKPIVAVPTMDAWVRLAPAVQPAACVLMHSRKGEVFRAVYRAVSGRWEKLGGFEAVPVEGLAGGLPAGPVLFLGDGSLKHREAITRMRPDARFPEGADPNPSGAKVAEVGLEILAAGGAADLDALSPMYLQNFQGMP